jgi:glycine cleavage system H protein
MSNIRYTEQHEWVRLDGAEVTVGVTRYAVEKMGDVVFVELPEPGRKVGQNGEIAVVESVKAASEVYAPVGGEVAAVNDVLASDPAKVNSDPEGEGWLFRLKLSDRGQLDKLMTEQQYQTFLEGV